MMFQRPGSEAMRGREASDSTAPHNRPLRLAYFSPLPPAASGVADYSQELLPHLQERVQLTLFAEDSQEVASWRRAGFDVRRLADYEQARWDFDLALYHIGNSLHHQEIYHLALRHPGVAVLHDYGLYHFVAELTAGQGDWLAFTRELAYERGPSGMALAWQIAYGRAGHPTRTVPFNRRLIDRCLGLIVHSRYAASQIQGLQPARPLAIIPALIQARTGRSRRAELNLPESTVILASTGMVTAAKQIDLALRAFARLRQRLPTASYLVVGEMPDDSELPNLVRALGLQEAVHFTGHVPDLEDFVDWTATADIVVNLRYPTVGETSATALRAMAAGRPLIVFNHGWYRELPDQVCVKLAPLDEDALLGAMERLARDEERRQTIGQYAMDYVKNKHDPASVASQYVAFLQQLQADRWARFSLPARADFARKAMIGSQLQGETSDD